MREQVETCVRDSRIIAIIRGYEPTLCLKLAEAYAKGGVKMVEVTYVQTDRALWTKTTDAISAIARRFAGDVHVGAGTVLTAEQLEMTRDAGGEFMVAPNVDEELIVQAMEWDMASMPGALTPTEVEAAWAAGASFVKLFPAGQMGPGYVKALKAPLKHVSLLAVGGITPDNIGEFMKAGCVGAGVSGVLQNKEWIEAGAWDKIADVARLLVERSKP